MGSLERARRIAKGFGSLVRMLVEKGLTRCGNCRWRYQCLQEHLPMKEILHDLSAREEYADHAGTIAKAVAHFLKNYCLKLCMDDAKMPRCVAYLCTYCGCPEYTDSIIGRACMYSMLGEDTLARRIQASIDRNLATVDIKTKMSEMMLSCVKNGKFSSGVCSEAKK